jgi:hypothetical protein
MLLARPGREGVDSLSETATVVWELLGTPRTLGSLVDLLAEAYAAHRENIAADVELLVEELIERGWVEDANGA